MFTSFLPRVNRKNDNNNRTSVMNIDSRNYTPLSTMNMGFISQNTLLPTPSVETMSLSDTVNNPTVKPRDMPWAQPTWILLHTLAEKVDNEHFSEIRTGLLNIIYTIVTLLPCPICAQHGKEFLDGINFNTIVTKDNLKYLLFDFHNLVNNKKQYPTFQYPDLVKYESAITVNVIQHFMTFFSKNSGSIRLIADDLYRKRMTLELKRWFNENIQYFSQ